MGHMQLTLIQTISIWVLPILFAVTAHEAAHGYAAYLLGDKTASVLGRLTLNPVKHIDVFGTLIVPITLLLLNIGVILGWAKPVPVNHHNFNNPRRDMALVALAGPSSNFIMAIIWAAITKGSAILLMYNFPGALAIHLMGEAGISINLMLMILNLLPIPPLDGSHIVAGMLPRVVAAGYERIAPYGFFILLALLYFGVIDVIVVPVIQFLHGLIGIVFGLP
ncbi:Peptidase M50 [Gammaproteobacteria bacterium]